MPLSYRAGGNSCAAKAALSYAQGRISSTGLPVDFIERSDWFPLHQQRNFLYTNVLEALFIRIRKGLIIFIHVLFLMIAEFSNVLFFGSTAADAAVTSRPCGPQ